MARGGHRQPTDPIETGRIDEPKFQRGFNPRAYNWKPPQSTSPWNRHFDLGRAHPRQWMMVGEYKKGGPKFRRLAIRNDRRSIENYVHRWWPLERWELSQIVLTGTWCDRELYMRFLGELTPEEDALDRKKRRERWDELQVKRAENKVRREAEARAKALEERTKAEVKIRARHKPGQ
jgi:hypothetical protein